MKKYSKIIITAIVLIVLVIAGISLIKKAKQKDENAPIAKTYDVVVAKETVKQDSVKLTLPYLAIVQNDKDVMMSSKVAARVLYIKPSGSKVRKGEVIVKLDNTPLQSNISSVKSQIAAVDTAIKNMIATHNRTLELLKVDGASVEQSQQEETKISTLQAKKDALKQNANQVYNTMSYAVIKSPVDGMVSKTMLNRGDMAMPGHPIANLKAKKGFYLLVRVPSDMDIKGVEVNNNHFDAIPLNSTFNGLAEYKAYASIPNLKSGDRLEVNVELFNGKGILLPFDAVLNRNGKSYVLIKDNDKATPKEIQIIEKGEQGIVVSNQNLVGKDIIVAKQDILLKLLSGVSLKIKGE
ncbi:MAG TPA: efflux RND transporter periplasmic adaptor subunit [Flavobacteriia bacterium]|nr:efflux RND transporter periplasmic adaptor subunit [Flavobacteriia bacterium]